MDDNWDGILGPGDGKEIRCSAPLSPGGETYWQVAARIRRNGDDGIQQAAIALKGPIGPPRRLYSVEEALVDGRLKDADDVLDAVRDLIECQDDEHGSAAAKSYIAGWLCADAVGRCLI